MAPKRTVEPETVTAKLRLANINRKSRVGALEYSNAIGAPAVSVCFACQGENDPVVEKVKAALATLATDPDKIMVNDWQAPRTLRDPQLMAAKAGENRHWIAVTADINNPTITGRKKMQWQIDQDRARIEPLLAKIAELNIIKGNNCQWVAVEKTGPMEARR